MKLHPWNTESDSLCSEATAHLHFSLSLTKNTNFTVLCIIRLLFWVSKIDFLSFWCTYSLSHLLSTSVSDFLCSIFMFCVNLLNLAAIYTACCCRQKWEYQMTFHLTERAEPVNQTSNCTVSGVLGLLPVHNLVYLFSHRFTCIRMYSICIAYVCTLHIMLWIIHWLLRIQYYHFLSFFLNFSHVVTSEIQGHILYRSNIKAMKYTCH